MERYIIVERYADNGELSHRALVDSTDGRELGTDSWEPEDHSFWRDWAWVPAELNKAQATVEELQRERDKAVHARGVYEKLYGVAGMGRNIALNETKTLQASLDAEREKVENLEHKIQSRGGLALIDDARAKAGLYDQLETQLEQLQALVRAAEDFIVAMPLRLHNDHSVDWKAGYNHALYDVGQVLAGKRTLDATTPAVTIKEARHIALDVLYNAEQERIEASKGGDGE